MSTSEPYGEGERVFGPPDGSFDADWVAATARQHDPGLPPETAVMLAGQAWAQLQELGELDAPALARAMMAANPGLGASPCNVVATAAVSFCQSYGVHPA